MKAAASWVQVAMSVRILKHIVRPSSRLMSRRRQKPLTNCLLGRSPEVEKCARSGDMLMVTRCLWNLVPDSGSDSHQMSLEDVTLLLRKSGPSSCRVPALTARTIILLGHAANGKGTEHFTADSPSHRLTTRDFGAMLHLRLRMRSQLGRCTSAGIRTAVRPLKPPALCTLLLGGALGLALARPTFCAPWPKRESFVTPGDGRSSSKDAAAPEGKQ